MPELPEMETYRTLLSERATGKPIVRVTVEREKTVNLESAAFARRVQGRRIVRIDRRAKHLLFRLDSGDTLLLHLMLGGWMFYGTEGERSERTAQVTLSFGGDNLYFHGLRLGYLHLYGQGEAERRLAELGPEPLDPGMSAERFRAVLGRKRGTLKPVLVDQKVISGIGNCYSDEICFYAGVRPSRSVAGLSDGEWLRLYEGMRAALQEAIAYGGYMEYPLFAGDTHTGRYNDRCKVYDNEGAACPRCGQTIIREEVASRKSFRCPNCQQ